MEEKKKGLLAVGILALSVIIVSDNPGGLLPDCRESPFFSCFMVPRSVSERKLFLSCIPAFPPFCFLL